MQNVIWLPVAMRISLPGNSALQNDGHIKPVILQCRIPWETNPKCHWGPNYFSIKSLFFVPPSWSWYVLGPSVIDTARRRNNTARVVEERADTDHDHIYTEAKINRKMAPQLALESVSRGVWRCVAHHFQNAAQRSAKPQTGSKATSQIPHYAVPNAVQRNAKPQTTQCVARSGLALPIDAER